MIESFLSLNFTNRSPGPAYNLSSYKGILGTEKGLSLKDSSPTRKATENTRSNSKANLRDRPKEVILLVELGECSHKIYMLR